MWNSLEYFLFMKDYSLVLSVVQCLRTFALAILSTFTFAYHGKESPNPFTLLGLWPDCTVFKTNFVLIATFKIGRFYIKYGFQVSLERNIQSADSGPQLLPGSSEQGLRNAACRKWHWPGATVLLHLFISHTLLCETFLLWPVNGRIFSSLPL